MLTFLADNGLETLTVRIVDGGVRLDIENHPQPFDRLQFQLTADESGRLARLLRGCEMRVVCSDKASIARSPVKLIE